MQTGCGRRHRSAFACVDGLVALPVAIDVCAMNIGRQRDMSQLLDFSKEIGYRLKAKCPLAEFAVRNDLGPQHAVSEVQDFSRQSLAPRPREHSPLPFGELFCEQDLDAARGLMTRLRVESCTMREEARWNHAAVVEDKQIAFSEQFGKAMEHSVFIGSRAAIEHEHARSAPLRGWLLRNQFFGKFVVEIGDQHSGHFSGDRWNP